MCSDCLDTRILNSNFGAEINLQLKRWLMRFREVLYFEYLSNPNVYFRKIVVGNHYLLRGPESNRRLEVMSLPRYLSSTPLYKYYTYFGDALQPRSL